MHLYCTCICWSMHLVHTSPFTLTHSVTAVILCKSTLLTKYWSKLDKSLGKNIKNQNDKRRSTSAVTECAWFYLLLSQIVLHSQKDRYWNSTQITTLAPHYCRASSIGQCQLYYLTCFAVDKHYHIFYSMVCAGKMHDEHFATLHRSLSFGFWYSLSNISPQSCYPCDYFSKIPMPNFGQFWQLGCPVTGRFNVQCSWHQFLIKAMVKRSEWWNMSFVLGKITLNILRKWK